MKIWPGNPYPLGATYDGSGTNFSIFSEKAEKIELCLFDSNGNETRVDLPENTGFCWHGYIPKIIPGQCYGYRVYGPWNPDKGQLFNPSKLLLDPYAKAIQGEVKWDDAVFPYNLGQKNDKDSSPFVPRSVVHGPFFDWTGDNKLNHSWNETIIYEVHVKGFSIKNPEIPPELRGSYAGLSHPSSIEYFEKLGVTAIELMPIHFFIDDKFLVEKHLTNYWGYNTLGFFAPHTAYSSDKTPGSAVSEFKEMVRKFHKAGIEVILDVVYNHTCEGNQLGPMLSFKGIDNSYYYRLAQDPRYYTDYTGTGNSLNMRNPHVLQLLMDSLRYWVLDMHVDGFRFDLASALARELHDVDRLSAFFDIIQQDPVISQVKLIAEPWDVGEGGYQVGNFPPGWSEWNGKYRDCARDFWRGNNQTLNECASRFTGSSDLYKHDGRLPFASVNFITCHDGFTMNDLVSYNEKHNEANWEENRDGENFNRSWNCGAEGPTDNPDILKLRTKQKRNFFTSLLLSQGAPMILGGDEIGRTQKGNNNAYCQDNEISWFDWDNVDKELLDFCRKLVHYRKSHPVFHRRRWFEGCQLHGSKLYDIEWFANNGFPIESQDWGKGFIKCMGIFLNGKTIPNPNPHGETVTDDSFYLIFNSYYEPLEFTLPKSEWGKQWIKELDTSIGWLDESQILNAEQKFIVDSRSTVVLRNAS